MKKVLIMMINFAPVARLESIRIMVAFTSYMNIKLYQMDVNVHC